MIAFNDFFQALWGHSAYPWQIQLAERVRESGWPDVVDLPTGVGKTAVLDIALHRLITAGEAGAPRRMIVVVDRRVIVDQVGARATAIRQRIIDWKSEPDPTRRDILQATHDALRAVSGNGAPVLHTEVLRGAMTRSDAWAAYPHVAVLAASTVDQVGSRLFFRGYGVSDALKSIHAGLLGCDTLLFLDEVHLSHPFANVLDQFARLREAEGDRIARRMRVIKLSATPGIHDPEQSVFRLDDADRRQPALARILGASKPAVLAEVPVKARSDEATKRQAVAEAAAAHARTLVTEGLQAIAVVVNRVDTARRVWRLLGEFRVDAVLLTGRMRPLDQEGVTQRVTQRVAAGARNADGAGRPIVVVATQSIEAGADYDFDGLVTEVASLDALRQRFGRLDRRGEYRERRSPDGASPTRAVILGRTDSVTADDDPVYGSSLRATWEWLRSIEQQGTVDFGIDALAPHLTKLDDGIEPLLMRRREAPVLLPAYLDRWVQTNPRPAADPDVSLFLHGIPESGREAMADVRVVWRADIEPELLQRIVMRDVGWQVELDRVKALLNAVPPGSLEALSLPVWTVRGWLRGAAVDDGVGDVEGVTPPAAEETTGAGRPVILWNGRENVNVVSAKQLSPGATIIIPQAYGGIGEHGSFDPESTGEDHRPADLGDVVQLRQRGRPTLRFDDRVWPGEKLEGLIPAADGSDEERLEVEESLPSTLDELKGRDLDGRLKEIVDNLDRRSRWLDPMGRRIAVSRQSFVPRYDEPLGIDAAEDEDDRNFSGESTGSLQDHLIDVARLMEQYAVRLGLSKGVAATLVWAAKLHDVGKADPRFQLWLYGGDAIATRFGGVRAKSALPPQDQAARATARDRAGYPRGQRHELVSLAMIEQSAVLRERLERTGVDWDLLLHLVASHHGWCRALAPVLESANGGDPVAWTVEEQIELAGSSAHGRDRLDSGVTDRFWRLNRKYGRHELAWLEALLRLADHRQSAREEASHA